MQPAAAPHAVHSPAHCLPFFHCSCPHLDERAAQRDGVHAAALVPVPTRHNQPRLRAGGRHGAAAAVWHAGQIGRRGQGPCVFGSQRRSSRHSAALPCCSQLSRAIIHRFGQPARSPAGSSCSGTPSPAPAWRLWTPLAHPPAPCRAAPGTTAGGEGSRVGKREGGDEWAGWAARARDNALSIQALTWHAPIRKAEHTANCLPPCRHTHLHVSRQVLRVCCGAGPADVDAVGERRDLVCDAVGHICRWSGAAARRGSGRWAAIDPSAVRAVLPATVQLSSPAHAPAAQGRSQEPVEVRESAPITTPPSKLAAMMVVPIDTACGNGAVGSGGGV